MTLTSSLDREIVMLVKHHDNYQFNTVLFKIS